MDRRHQVFVSSTYEDLRVERSAVMESLLLMECFPAGMELFPASNDDSWALIKRVIQESDYYIVLVGGKYGSVTDEDVSFAEGEFDFAESLEKPMLGFLPKNPEMIPQGKSECQLKRRNALAAFVEKVKRRNNAFYESPEDLRSKILTSLLHMKQTHPTTGWVPASREINAETFDLDFPDRLSGGTDAGHHVSWKL